MNSHFRFKSFLVISILSILSIGFIYVFNLPSDESIPIKHRTDIKIKVNRDIAVENYFKFMDSIVRKYDSITSYPLTEHLLVRANPWIIDTLKNTDYYIQKEKGFFIYDQKKMIVLAKGIDLILPDSTFAQKMIKSFQKTEIDINIPEFSLRIKQDSIELYKFPIRVGRDEKKYLQMSGRIQDLKTKTGEGTIVKYNRYPKYINPVNNHQYFQTKRDDDRITKLPQIPFIETEINHLRYGQLIHSTTNPITLGKAYSNGCIGTRESDAWVIYYYAPIGTRINIRYDLTVKDESGKSTELKDIYEFGEKND